MDLKRGRLKWLINKLKEFEVFDDFFEQSRLKEIVKEVFKEFEKNNYDKYFNYIIKETIKKNKSDDSFFKCIYDIMKNPKFKSIWSFKEFELSTEHLIQYWYNPQ